MERLKVNVLLSDTWNSKFGRKFFTMKEYARIDSVEKVNFARFGNENE
jgi:hypothetical protein